MTYSDESDALFAKWVSWFERINDDISYLHRDREVWRDLVAMIDANKAIPESWWIKEWITQLTVKGLALGIRRQTDKGRDVISLVRLLNDIKKNPSVMSRDRFIAICSPGDDDYMVLRVNLNFDQWAGPGGSEIDPGLVQKRLDAPP